MKTLKLLIKLIYWLIRGYIESVVKWFENKTGLADKKERKFFKDINKNLLKEKPPTGIKFVDLGKDSTCTRCLRRYCICKQRQNGTWESDLPIQLI